MDYILADCPEHIQKLSVGAMDRHRHSISYAAIVLEGCYIERGSAGRWVAEAGHVVAHRMFDSHCNHVLHENTRVLNVPMLPGMTLPPLFTVHDPDALISAAQVGSKDVFELLQPAQILSSCEADWPDMLALALSSKPFSISSWAENMGLASATVSRGFFATYGVSPSRFRLEAQTIRALQSFLNSSRPSADIAFECGFSDQAHLCRSLKEITGRTPSEWQRIKSIQDSKTASQ
jgi:AraC-like DNA-binding protein